MKRLLPLLAAALLIPVGASAQQGDQPTPMEARVATIAILDKVSGRATEYEAKPGDRIEFRALSIRIVACETTPPWAEREETGAFLQIEEKRASERRGVFSGWLFAESSSLNSFDHPYYDVWVRACTMDFPMAGPDTVVVN